MCLQVVNNVAQLDAQGFGNSQEGINGDGPVGAFDLADINRVKIGLLSQFFLAQAGFLSAGANVFSDELAVFWNGRHKPSRNQQGGNGP